MSYETALKNLEYGLEQYLEILKTDGIVQYEYNVLSDDVAVEDETITYAIFQIPIVDIFNEVKKRTAILARHQKDPKTGESFFEQIAMTDDEEELFNSLNLSAATDIFSKMTPEAKDLTTAFLYNSGPTIIAFSLSAYYNINDYVTYQNTIYKCIALPGLETAEEYNPATNYADQDMVIYNDELYTCINDGTLGILPTNTSYWTKGQKDILPTDTDMWEEQSPYVDTLNKITMLINFGTTKDQNTIPVLTQNIFDLHVFYVMAEWFDSVGRFDLGAGWKAKYLELLDKFHFNLVKRKSITRPALFM